ncbi:MAG: glycoside hydrolase family 88 protein [Candidatus Marinimicrobia bacterium]|nr:glycoside hydrolase family 88 protein [Candidatus Neomarinimicrobiota bacterium]
MVKKIVQNSLFFLIICLIPLTLFNSCNKNTPDEYCFWATRTVDSFIQRAPDYTITYEQNREKHKWNYEQGLMLNAVYALWSLTGEQNYLYFIQKNIDLYVNDDGSISTYKQKDFKLDDIGPGRTLLRLYRKTNDVKYKLAANQLRQQLHIQPRTLEGGFWHKNIYPWQMWLDGLYMAAPFYAEYEKEFSDQPDYEDIIKQFQLIYHHTLDPETGLLYHGWDEKHQQIWADPETGLSRHFWGRGVGWYMMALVDVLEILPENTSDRLTLLNQFQTLSRAVLRIRDSQSKVWYQVLNQGNRAGNYLESSASAMFIYSFAKGAKLGYLPVKYYDLAVESFKGFIDQFVIVNDSGLVDVLHACSGAGLGGKQQREGSFEYYISEPQRNNDFKAVGPFILAAVELEKGCQKASE